MATGELLEYELLFLSWLFLGLNDLRALWESSFEYEGWERTTALEARGLLLFKNSCRSCSGEELSLSDDRLPIFSQSEGSLTEPGFWSAWEELLSLSFNISKVQNDFEATREEEDVSWACVSWGNDVLRML